METTDRTEDYLIGVRLREPAPAADYRLAGALSLHVGEFALVETANGTTGGCSAPRLPTKCGNGANGGRAS